ncbi:MAG: hypothetical protein RO469_02660 [Thermincola sp.]|nr:hypothetical protein [Thermincola sp.]
MYIKLGKWIIRSDFLIFFMRRGLVLKHLLHCKILSFVKNEATEKTHFIRIKEAGFPKVMLFNLKNKEKKSIWVYDKDFKREVRALKCLARHSVLVPEMMAVDYQEKSMTLALVGVFLKNASSLPQTVQVAIKIATTPNLTKQVKYASYIDHMIKLLKKAELNPEFEVVIKILRSVVIDLQKMQTEPQNLYLGFSQGDLSKDNVLIDEIGNLYIHDFDKAAVNSIYYDLVYLHLMNKDFDREQLLNSINKINSYLVTLNATPEEELYKWCIGLFILDAGRYLFKKYYSLPMADEIDRYHKFTAERIFEAFDLFEVI